MVTATQAWVRAELSGSTGGVFGAQLMIPADSMEFHGDDVVFQRQGEVVYVAEPGQLRSVTWMSKAPNPELELRKAQWPKHGTRWSDEEREELLTRLRAGEAWSAISKAHGRSRTGVQQEAVKQGWVDDVRFELVEAYRGVGAETGTAATAEATAGDGQADQPDSVAGDQDGSEPTSVTDEAQGGT